MENVVSDQTAQKLVPHLPKTALNLQRYSSVSSETKALLRLR